MNTPQAQIKLNLPLPLKEFAESKAKKFGMPLAGYLKHLILKDVEELEYPVFQASELTERAYKEAIKERKNAVKVVGNIDAFLDKI